MQPSSVPEPPARLARALAALLVAAIAAIAFLGPALLPGRALVPFPPEHIPPLRSEASARGVPPEAILVGNPSGGDKFNQSFTWDRIARDRLRQGSLPLWTRDLGGGAPVVPQMGQIYMPWTWLLLLFDSTTIYGPWFLAHQCLLGLLLYHFLRRLGVQHAAALFGMTCAVVGLWTQARVHHNVILSGALPLFGALSCVQALFAGGRLGATGLLALAGGLPWLSGFAPVALQSTYVTVAFALLCAGRAPRGARAAPLARVAVGLLIGGLIACPQMLPVLAAAQDTARAAMTDAVLRANSMSLAHALTLVWPDLLNWAQPAFYDGSLDQARIPFAALWLLDQTTANAMNWPETAFAIGVPGIALAAAGLGTRTQRPVAWFFAALAVLGFALATTASPVLALTHVVPGARSGDFRRYLFLPAMALPVLAGLGAQRWLAGESLRPQRAFLAAIALVSLVLFAVHLANAAAIQRTYAQLAVPRYAEFGVTVEAFEAATKPNEGADNRARLLATFLRAFLAAGLAFAAMAALKRRTAALAVLVVLSIAELVHAGRGPVVAVPSQRVDQPPAILAPALADARVAGPRPRFHRIDLRPDTPTRLLQPNLGAFWGLEDLAVYTSLAPRRQEEFHLCLEPPRAGVPKVVLGGSGVQSLRQVETLSHPLCDVIGLQWVLSSEPLSAPGWIDRTPADWRGAERIYERTGCAPRATFVARVRMIADRAERLRALADRTRDAVHEVILEEPRASVAADPAVAAAAQVRPLLWEDERIVLDVDAPTPGFVRIADPFDAGWTARVDGTPVHLYIADHWLRAVAVPAGTHRIELAYDAPRVRWPPRLGLIGAGLALSLLIGGLIGGLVCGRRRIRSGSPRPSTV